MDRCAVLIDAGYLLGAAATILVPDHKRHSLAVEYAPLVKAIIAEAEQQTGLPVLRVLWYDGAQDALPAPEHRSLSVLPDLKVRLGMLVRHGGKVEQKGVDSFLQRDLTTLARNHAVADIVLLGGDEDLRRGLDEAQDYGVKVHLWGVEAAEPEYNQSRSLIAEADRRWVISADWIGRYVSPKPPREAPPAQVEPLTTSEPEPPRVHATPADLARLAAHVNQRGLSTPSSSIGTTVHEPRLPNLRELSAPRAQWQDTEEDNAGGPVTATEIGTRYGSRWAARATADQRALVDTDHPFLPRELDAEVLKYANNLGIDTWDDEEAKHAVRAAVWDAIDAAKAEG